MSSGRTLRKDTFIFLIGNCEPQIVGTKLPSVRQVLKVLFFNMREVKLNLRDSAALTIKEIIIFWNKARIPTRDPARCIDKLETLYNKWRDLQKNSKKPSERLKQKQDLFVSTFDDLFDIAHANALELLTIEEDKQFLINQRKKGRPGSMCGIDLRMQQQEKRALEREEKFAERKQRNVEALQTAWETTEFASTSDSSSPAKSSTSASQDENLNPQDKEQAFGYLDPKIVEPGPSAPKRRRILRAHNNVITEKLVAILDKCRISDRDAVHILSATAEALGHDVKSLTVNRSSIHRTRQKLREKRAQNLRDRFKETKLQAVVVHWDGKLLPSITGKGMVERLPIIVTDGDTEQILRIPTLPSATGKDQAIAVYDALLDWGLTDAVKALCCDTTSSNLGHRNGASVLLEHMLQKDLLYLPCRHHIFEVILRSVFEIKMPSSTGPNVPIFKRFQNAWPQIKQDKFKSATSIKKIERLLQDDKQEILAFTKSNLGNKHPREDYREFLELIIVFLGDTPPRGIFFRVPGAIHHARWMAKAIYCLKIFLFRNEFDLSEEENSGIMDICVFIVKIYARAWFTAPSAAEAPNNDFQFFKKLIDYKVIDPEISRVALNKFKNHLWYLSPEAIAFSFFDNNLSLQCKRKMVKTLNQDEEQNHERLRRAIIKPEEIPGLIKKGLEFFVTPHTKEFFTMFNINLNFLTIDPSQWLENADYKKGFEIVNKLKVINDAAERGVKLISDYNKLLTKDEEQKHFILQIVSDYRHHFPDAKKETVLQNL